MSGVPDSAHDLLKQHPHLLRTLPKSSHHLLPFLGFSSNQNVMSWDSCQAAVACSGSCRRKPSCRIFVEVSCACCHQPCFAKSPDSKQQAGEQSRGWTSSAEEPLPNTAEPWKFFMPELICKGSSSGTSLCLSPSPVPPFHGHSHFPERQAWKVEPQSRKRQILTCCQRQREKLKRGDGSGVMNNER